MSHKVPIHSTSLQSNPIQHNPGKMSQFLLRETLKRKQHTNVRFINKRTDDAKSVGNISSSSNTTLSSVGTVSAPTFVSHVGTMGATSSTHESSTQSSLPTSSNQSSVSTSVQSSTPASTTSSIPRSTTNGSESVEENIGIQHQGYLLGSTGLDGRLYIGVRDKELFPSGPCSSIIYESFGERADLNGYNWATLSDETKLLYWDEFHKKCHWDDAKTPLVQACWENKAKERYRQYIYNISSKWKKSTLKKKPVNITSEVWTSWTARWNTEDFKKKSEQNKKNRRRGVVDGQALSTHTGGSASHSKIASDLKKLWGHDPAHHELFLYTHTKNHDGVTFLVDKAKKIHDDFMEQCDRLEAIGEEIDEDKLFYDVVGGHDRKKRLYGFGSYGKRIRSSKGSSEMHREQYEDNNAETKVEIENLKKLVETQREQYEDIQQKYEDVQQKYEDAQKKNVEFQQKNVDVQAKFEQQLAQAMNVINTLSEQVKNFINQ
ncbi:hypothetical protein Lser_V15G12231 [Lactuca serriola]